MKNMGYRRVRYRGRRRNEVDFALNLIAYNWKTSLSLTKAARRLAPKVEKQSARWTRPGSHAVTSPHAAR